MTINSQEHYELIAMFDREFSHMRLDKEPKGIWSKEHVYQNGEANSLFLAYRRGFALGKAMGRT